MRIPALDLQIGTVGQVQISATLDERIVREQSLKVSGETAADHEQKETDASQSGSLLCCTRAGQNKGTLWTVQEQQRSHLPNRESGPRGLFSKCCSEQPLSIT